MVTAVFLLGVLNFGLGFALAVAIDRMPLATVGLQPSPLALVRKHLARRKPVDEDSTGGDTQPATSDQQRAEVVADCPFAEKQAANSSPLESLLWRAKLETAPIRVQLVALHEGVTSGTDPDSELLRSTVENWTALLDEWVRLATAHKDESPEIGARLEERLLDHAFELQSSADLLSSESPDAEQLLTLIDAANVMRDDVDDLLARWLASHGRLDTLDDQYKTSGENPTLTRLGLEDLFASWWEADSERLRLVSLVMIDLDRFSKLNHAAGARLGDVALERFAGILHDSVRKDRGFDRVARVAGQRFLLFLGDTSAKNASKGAERIRQTFEATSLLAGDESIAITTSCAVVQIEPAETGPDAMQRLETALAEVKKAGRNLTYCDAGEGPALVELPLYEVNGRVIDLREE